jgi:hypothetical protein
MSLTSMVGGGGTTNYTYTARSRLLTEDGAFTSDDRIRRLFHLRATAGGGVAAD